MLVNTRLIQAINLF